MNARRGSQSNRFLYTWLPVTIIVIALGALLVAPRRVRNLISVDNEHLWQHNEAPPKRQVVWEPANRIEVETPNDKGGDSFIHPQLTDSGTVLYFTVRDVDGSADIYRSRMIEGVWENAEPVTELNTAADDIGPVISKDGSQLYLYSDRAGGVGGFDLYVSRRTPDGWSQPTNLGPRVNTLANDYAPALSADGKSLYFSSNRNKRMQKYAEEYTEGAPAKWTETLRAQQGLVQYDLYVLKREDSNAPWGPANPVSELNRSNSNEGTPFVSPSGAFLYFTSDRPHRGGEEPNYDLYRARRHGGSWTDLENLGTSVNTAANELDPAISHEGFRLVFSSDRVSEDSKTTVRPSEDELYAIYTSTSKEVIEDVAWSESRLPWVIRQLWWILLLLLIAGLIAGLIWFLRRVSFRRAPVPGFFLVALLLHLMLATGMFFVGLGGELVERIKDKIEQAIAMDFAESNSHQSHKPGQESYEKMSDLTSVETVQTSDVYRQVTDVPSVPVPTDEVAPMLPTQIDRDLPPEQYIYTPPKAPAVRTQPFQLARRQPVRMETLEQEQVEINQPAEQPQTAQQEIQQTDVEVQRAERVMRLAKQTPMLQRATNLQNLMQPERETLDAQAVKNLPSPTNTTRAIELVRNTQPIQSETESIQIDQVDSAQANAPANLTSTNQSVEVMRGQSSANAAIPSTTSRSISLLLRASQAELAANRASRQTAPPEAAQRSLELARASRVLEAIDETAEVVVDPSQAASDDAAVVSALNAAQPDVDVGQQDTMTKANPAKPMFDAASELKKSNSSQKESILPDQSRMLASVSSSRRLDNPLQRVLKELEVESTTAETGQLSEPEGERSLAASSTTVTVQREGDTAPQLRASMNSTQAAAPQTAAKSDSNDETEQADAYNRVKSTEVVAALSRRSADTEIESDAVETVELAHQTADKPNQEVSGIPVGVQRSDAQIVKSEAKTASKVGGRYDPQQSRPVIGSVAKDANNALPSFSTIASRISRRPARAPETLYAVDSVGLEGMFQMRQGNAKDILLKAYGGTEETKEAISRGLLWLQIHQFEDGHWSLHEFGKCCKGHARCSGQGGSNSDTAATGFALLPFLGDGHTHKSGAYQQMIKRGLHWLVAKQQSTGELSSGREGNGRMYSHAIAAIALCEAYGMTRDEELKEPAEKAIEFIIYAQDQASGGWRYQPRQRGDTSVVGWQVMALKSGQMAGIEIPKSVFALTNKWLDSVEGQGDKQGQYGYSSRSPSVTMTAEALLCREYLGMSRENPSLWKGGDYLLANLPNKGKPTSYYLYYGTQTMFHLQGDYWTQWNAALQQSVINSQHKTGPLAGTWDAVDSYEKSGGRIYATSLRLLMLEAAYRHLPLYQVLE